MLVAICYLMNLLSLVCLLHKLIVFIYMWLLCFTMTVNLSFLLLRGCISFLMQVIRKGHIELFMHLCADLI